MMNGRKGWYPPHVKDAFGARTLKQHFIDLVVVVVEDCVGRASFFHLINQNYV